MRESLTLVFAIQMESMRFVGFYRKLDNNCFNFSPLVKEKNTDGDLTICSERMIYEMKKRSIGPF